MTARVLVVDDILANVRLLEAKLTAEYFEVVTAMNGVDALEAVQRTRPDIILLDVMMPDMDGYEVCRRLKANPETARIPIVFITAKTSEDDRAKGIEAGAVDYIHKPFETPVLIERVQAHLSLRAQD